MRRVVPLLLLLLLAYVAVSQMSRPAVPDGVESPELRVELDGGSVLDLDDLPRIQVLVLNFWATWCPPCREEAPVLSGIHRPPRVRVVGLAADVARLPDVARAARSLGMRYPIGLASAAVRGRFQVEVLPTTYVIHRGRIVRSFVGMASEQQLRDAIAEARASQAPR